MECREARVVQLTNVLPQIFLGSNNNDATRSSGDGATTRRNDEHLDGLELSRVHCSIAKWQVGKRWLSEYEEMIHKQLALIVSILDCL